MPTQSKDGVSAEQRRLQEQADAINTQVQQGAIAQERATWNKKLSELENRVFALEKIVHKPKRTNNKTDN